MPRSMEDLMDELVALQRASALTQDQTVKLMDKLASAQLQFNGEFISHRREFQELKDKMWALFAKAFWVTLFAGMGFGLAYGVKWLMGL